MCESDVGPQGECDLGPTSKVPGPGLSVCQPNGDLLPYLITMQWPLKGSEKFHNERKHCGMPGWLSQWNVQPLISGIVGFELKLHLSHDNT